MRAQLTVGEDDAERLREGQQELLLVLSQRGTSRAILELAIETARTLGARLHLLHVVPRGSGLSERSSLIAESLGMLQSSLAAQSAAGSCHGSAPAKDMVASIAVLSGGLVQQTAAYAAAIRSTMIVIAGAGARVRSQAAAVARAAQRPVFVPGTAPGRAHTDAAIELGPVEPSDVRAARVQKGAPVKLGVRSSDVVAAQRSSPEQ